jgi:phage/plasmid-like protein (TIGR03299 family)
MAANLATTNGSAAMFSGSGIVPWHEFGVVIQGRANAAEALALAGLDWQVGKSPIFYNGNDAGAIFSPISIPDQYVTRRNDKVGQESILGIVGERYVVVQNEDCFGFFDSVIDKNEAIYESAGALGKGERVWILAKLPDQITLKNDPIDKYILLATSHDGSLNLTAKLVATRVVCQNTLRAALREDGESIRIRHTSTAQDRIAMAAAVMGLANKKFEETQKMYGALMGIKFNALMLDYYLICCMPSSGDNPTRASHMRDEVRELIEGKGIGSMLESAKGTAWGLYNGITEYVSRGTGVKENTSKLDALWFGSGAKLSGRAFETALTLPNVSESVMKAMVDQERTKAVAWENRQ